MRWWFVVMGKGKDWKWKEVLQSIDQSMVGAGGSDQVWCGSWCGQVRRAAFECTLSPSAARVAAAFTGVSEELSALLVLG